MSWCVMQDSIQILKTDMDVIFERTGGRGVDNEKLEPFITMSQCQVRKSLNATALACTQRVQTFSES